MKLRPVLAVLALAVMVACSAQPAPSTEPSASPTERPRPSDEPSAAPPSEPPSPSEPAVTGWQPASVPDTEISSSTVQVVPGGDGLIAIGFNGAFGSILWTSGDGGRTWTDITPADFASIGIVSVVEFDGMLVGVGRGDTINTEAEQAAVYLSEDGVEWRKVETADPLIGQMIDVVATDDGLFAVGGVPGADSAGVWHSPNGEAWERIGGDLDHAFLWAIAEGGPGLVAVGWRRNPEPDLAVWTSADAGATWELAPDPEGFAGFEGTDVAALPDGSLAMVGSALDGSDGRIWTSTDGIDWTMAVETLDGAYARSLAATPNGLVAVGGGDDMRGRAWHSTDGTTWAPLGEPVAEAFFTSAMAVEGGVLVTGATQTGTVETGIDSRAGIWLSSSGD